MDDSIGAEFVQIKVDLFELTLDGSAFAFPADGI